MFASSLLGNAIGGLTALSLGYILMTNITLIDYTVSSCVLVRFVHSLVLFAITMFPSLFGQLNWLHWFMQLLGQVFGGDMFFFVSMVVYAMYIAFQENCAHVEQEQLLTRLSNLHFTLTSTFLYLLRSIMVYFSGLILGLVLLVLLDSSVVLINCDVSIFAYANTVLVSLACVYQLNFVLPNSRRIVFAKTDDSFCASFTQTLRTAVHAVWRRTRRDVNRLSTKFSFSNTVHLLLQLVLLALLACNFVTPYHMFTLSDQLVDVYLISQRFTSYVVPSSVFYFYQMIKLSSFAIAIFATHLVFACTKFTFCRGLLLSFLVALLTFSFELTTYRLGNSVSLALVALDSFRFAAHADLLSLLVFCFNERCRLRSLVYRFVLALFVHQFVVMFVGRALVGCFVEEALSHYGEKKNDKLLLFCATINIIALALHPIAILLYTYLRCTRPSRFTERLTQDNLSGIELQNLHREQMRLADQNESNRLFVQNPIYPDSESSAAKPMLETSEFKRRPDSPYARRKSHRGTTSNISLAVAELNSMLGQHSRSDCSQAPPKPNRSARKNVHFADQVDDVPENSIVLSARNVEPSAGSSVGLSVKPTIELAVEPSVEQSVIHASEESSNKCICENYV